MTTASFFETEIGHYTPNDPEYPDKLDMDTLKELVERMEDEALAYSVVKAGASDAYDVTVESFVFPDRSRLAIYDPWQKTQKAEAKEFYEIGDGE